MPQDPDPWRRRYLDDIRRAFLEQREVAELAVDQLDEADVFRAAGGTDNSVAVLLKHVGGNLRSRWTLPFETDGEKPDRNRDGEFEVGGDSAAGVRSVWEAGWAVLDATLSALRPSDLERRVRIRGEEIALVTALHRSLTHTSQHVGQIILLAKQWRGEAWRKLR